MDMVLTNQLIQTLKVGSASIQASLNQKQQQNLIFHIMKFVFILHYIPATKHSPKLKIYKNYNN